MTTQISLSFELICLINWLLKNETATLNSLVKNAIERGFAEELEKLEAQEQNMAMNQSLEQTEETDNLYNTLLDFLDFLEHSLIKNLETMHVDHKTKDAILPALQKIETDSLDLKTMWLSMQQTKARVSKKTGTKAARNHHNHDHKVVEKPQVTAVQNPTEILFEQLIKNWKPTSKETIN